MTGVPSQAVRISLAQIRATFAGEPGSMRATTAPGASAFSDSPRRTSYVRSLTVRPILRFFHLAAESKSGGARRTVNFRVTTLSAPWASAS